MHLVARLALWLLGAFLSLVLGVLVAASAGWYYLRPGLPDADTIRQVPLQVPLRIYSRDGRLIAELGEYRRIPVAYAEIPPVVVDAILAAEDDRFFEHPGFDYQGIVRAGINLLLTGQRSQGGSTITQQLARAYFLGSERTFVRKAREILLAMRIEEAFTKEEILALYLNKIFFGHRAYGIAAAAQVYFGKPLAALTTAEAATLAGIPKAPSVLNPVSDPERARSRRAYVLRRMRELGRIDEAAFDAALATPLAAHIHGPVIECDAPYVAEMARAEMVGRFGAEAYTAGYRVTTTVDSRLQREADRALRLGLLEYDQRHGYRGHLARGTFDRPGVEAGDARSLERLLDSWPAHAGLHPAVVTRLAAGDAVDFHVRETGPVRVPWANLQRRPYIDEATVGPAPASPGELFQPGDVLYLLKTAEGGWRLGQLPIAQAALVVLDPRDGATVALSGGYDFFASKFNRAVQARRQPGSSFKPFIYSAALENGYTPATIVNDAPVVFENAGPDGTWRPGNNTGRFYGPTRLREGLVRSLNLVSIRVLLDIGVGNAIRHIRPFGLPESALPANPTMALGSGGASPRDMAAGYAVFANGGHHIAPYLIDRIEGLDGQLVEHSAPAVVCTPCNVPWQGHGPDPALRPVAPPEERFEPPARDGGELPTYADATEMMAHAGSWRPGPDDTPGFHTDPLAAPRVISAGNAWLVYDMMRDVIRRGTGQRALALGRSDLAGKTGTSNDRRDTWFGGFNADLVATVWVGFDQERSLGPREEGSRTALPIWIDFMREALRGQPPAPLPRPPDIVTALISADSGLLAPAGAADSLFEVFRESDMAALRARSGSALATGGAPPPAAGSDEIF